MSGKPFFPQDLPLEEFLEKAMPKDDGVWTKECLEFRRRGLEREWHVRKAGLAGVFLHARKTLRKALVTPYIGDFSNDAIPDDIPEVVTVDTRRYTTAIDDILTLAMIKLFGGNPNDSMFLVQEYATPYFDGNVLHEETRLAHDPVKAYWDAVNGTESTD